MIIEEIVIAREIHPDNPAVLLEITEVFRTHAMKPIITEVSHDEFKKLTRYSKVIVRTGECTPLANVILKTGVVF